MCLLTPQTGVKVVTNAPSLQFPWLRSCQLLSFCGIFSNLQFSVVFLECLLNCKFFYPLTDVAGSCQRNQKAGSWYVDEIYHVGECGFSPLP